MKKRKIDSQHFLDSAEKACEGRSSALSVFHPILSWPCAHKYYTCRLIRTWWNKRDIITCIHAFRGQGSGKRPLALFLSTLECCVALVPPIVGFRYPIENNADLVASRWYRLSMHFICSAGLTLMLDLRFECCVNGCRVWDFRACLLSNTSFGLYET
jgi:hypothetical protein